MNYLANALLQAFVTSVTKKLDCEPLTRDEIITTQKCDEYCHRVRNYLESGIFPKDVTDKIQKEQFIRHTSAFIIEEGLLVKHQPTFQDKLDKSNQALKVVIPFELRHKILWLIHGHPLASHAGVVRTLYRAKQTYFWPNMKRDVIRFVRHCARCQACKPRQKTHVETTHLGPYAPFDCLSIDLTDIHSKWDEFLREIAFSLRTTISRRLDFSPAYLNYGRELRVPWDPRLPESIMVVDPENPHIYVQNLERIISDTYNHMMAHVFDLRERVKKHHTLEKFTNFKKKTTYYGEILSYYQIKAKVSPTN
uniref:RNA-directed DNA polymerase n=1 Tax=Strigamia maritima TaxID=126957 RepID=T1IQH7_STRMM